MSNKDTPFYYAGDIYGNSVLLACNYRNYGLWEYRLDLRDKSDFYGKSMLFYGNHKLMKVFASGLIPLVPLECKKYIF